MSNGCNGGSFCDGSRPSTAAERRAYNAEVRRRGGERSAAGRAYINGQHERYKAATRAHNQQHHGCAVVTFALLAGTGGLGWAAVELIQRAAGA